jgi:beta-phosphoglucomutase-like phosphatase (HAD superfamily)
VSQQLTLLDEVDAILFDFDGPVCHLFAGYPAHEIATVLRSFLLSSGATLSPSMQNSPNPLELLRWTAETYPAIALDTEDLLISAEQTAAQRAEPTHFSHDAIAASVESGRSVALVSNNSAIAIRSYLEMHNLNSLVSTVVGRKYGHPELMKPDPAPVIDASKQLDTPVGLCVLIGDAVTDIESAHSAGARSIGYAKHASRIARLTDAGPDAVIDSMATLVSALTQLGA